jgi:hypothetical protein
MGPLVYLAIVPSIAGSTRWLEQTLSGIMMGSMVCDSLLFIYKFSFEPPAFFRAYTLQDRFSWFHGWQVTFGHWFPWEQQQPCADRAAAVSESS